MEVMTQSRLPRLNHGPYRQQPKLKEEQGLWVWSNGGPWFKIFSTEGRNPEFLYDVPGMFLECSKSIKMLQNVLESSWRFLEFFRIFYVFQNEIFWKVPKFCNMFLEALELFYTIFKRFLWMFEKFFKLSRMFSNFQKCLNFSRIFLWFLDFSKIFQKNQKISKNFLKWSIRFLT